MANRRQPTPLDQTQKPDHYNQLKPSVGVFHWFQTRFKHSIRFGPIFALKHGQTNSVRSRTESGGAKRVAGGQSHGFRTGNPVSG